MITITYLGQNYSCTKAIKGNDYVHLLDANNNICAAFDDVSDFSGFTISGGTWTTPTPENDCYIAVIKDDGTIGKSGHRCSDISTQDDLSLALALSQIYRDTCTPNIIYRLNDDKKSYYMDGKNSKQNSEVKVAGYYEGLPVTAIGRGSDSINDNDGNFSTVASIVIPDTVKKICDCAFQNCGSLKDFVIPNSLEELGYDCFTGNSRNYNVYNTDGYYLGNTINPYLILVWTTRNANFTNYQIHPNTKFLAFHSAGTFENSKITTITIPSEVISISYGAFKNCISLSSVNIQTTKLKKLDSCLFYNCSALTSITFNGTKAQWNAISKGAQWDYGTGNYTIHCTDGDIAKA